MSKLGNAHLNQPYRKFLAQLVREHVQVKTSNEMC